MSILCRRYSPRSVSPATAAAPLSTGRLVREEDVRRITPNRLASFTSKGEILSLNWDGYDHATKTITLQAARAKTGHGRVIRCGQNPELVALLDRRLAARRLDSPLIFHNGLGRHVGNFSTSWGRALRNAEVAFAFHDLRRTAIRNMIRAGVPERVAMEISGHRTRAIFDRYNIVSGRDLDDAMAKRAAYEAEMSKTSGKANSSREPVAFLSSAPSPHR